MIPNQNILDYPFNGQQPQQQQQYQFNPMQFNQPPPHNQFSNQPFFQQQPQGFLPDQQQMYQNQQQQQFMMHPPPNFPILQPQQQQSASAQHNMILEQVLSKNNERQKNAQPKNACSIHPTAISKSCRTCRKIAAEQELKSKEQKDQEKKDRTDDEFDGDLIEVLPSTEKGENNVFNVWEQDSSSTLNPKLKTNIQNSNYFRIDLFNLKTYHEVIDEIQKHVNHAEPYAIGATGVPSTLFCCLLKFMLMQLTVKQVKGLVEYKQSPMVRAIGFLYVRFCCDPKYMFAWFKKHLLDDEEFKPGADKNSPNMTIGDYVEKLLSDQEYYGTRLPRIPIKIETKIKAKLILNQEKRERKKKNLVNIFSFQKESPVIAISSVDGEWHEGIVEKVEGKLVQVRFLPDKNFEGCNELVNLGEIELVNSDDINEDKNQSYKSKSRSRSVEKQKRRKSRSRSKSGKRKRSRSKDKKKKHSSRSRSHDKHKKHKKRSSRSRSRDRDRDRKHKRSRSKEENKAKSKIESMKQREQRIEEEIRRRQADQAVAYSKSDVARIPQSYKTALSGNISKIAQSGRSPSSGRREEFVETVIPSVAENRHKKQNEQEKHPTKQKTQEQIEKELRMLQIYGGDVQTKGSAYTQNRQASDYA
ncbi:hypothetical protein ABPG72_000300 [Tetrahymena utriculariae]